MVKFKNVEEITKSFINDGWNESPTFSELSEKEASKKGYSFAVNGIRKGRKYFVMSVSGNIFDDNGKIAMYNI